MKAARILTSALVAFSISQAMAIVNGEYRGVKCVGKIYSSGGGPSRSFVAIGQHLALTAQHATGAARSGLYFQAEGNTPLIEADAFFCPWQDLAVAKMDPQSGNFSSYATPYGGTSELGMQIEMTGYGFVGQQLPRQ